jgi:acyl-CoA dehydrogenase
MGIRASDTVSIVFQNARLPMENLLGSPTVEKSSGGFKGAMATFDATRPLVAASALGIARATLELLHEYLDQEGIQIRYGLPKQKLSYLEQQVIDMEIMLRSSWLLVLKAVWMADNKLHNPLEASMSKVKAGEVVTRITQMAVEIMGPLGFSRDLLFEKWFRDAKINDIFEGTGQINRLIVARNILGYRGSQLR